MALLFTSTITLPSGVEVNNAYGRVSAVDGYTGLTVDSIVDIWASEQAFNDHKEPLNGVDFKRTASVDYNRDTMGTDILAIGHDALVAALAAQGISANISL